ncbi:MAG: metallophosphoesterase [Candidatus Krumholzibacteriia bacterium]
MQSGRVPGRRGRERRRAPRRRRRLARPLLTVGGVLLALVLMLVGWGLVEPLTLRREEETAIVPGLPSAWEGRRIAAFGDLQIGMWWDNVGTVERAVDLVLAERPAAALILGDLVYHIDRPDAGEIATVTGILGRLPGAGIPTFAVLGNHDHGISREQDAEIAGVASALAAALEAVGVRVLSNQAVPLVLGGAGETAAGQGETAAGQGETVAGRGETAAGQGETVAGRGETAAGQGETVAGQGETAAGRRDTLYVVGIGSHLAGRDSVVAALRHVPPEAARVVFFHHPAVFPLLPAGAAPLAVAGHTHGGQFSLPGLPGWNELSLGREREVHAAGWADRSYGAPGNRLWVNRGIGMSIVPLRINAPPEVTFFTLQADPRRHRDAAAAAAAGGGAGSARHRHDPGVRPGTR